MNVEGTQVREAAQKKRIAIIGLPNTGKSLIFNHLTGEYTVVANYPLTTVEIKRAECRVNGCACAIYDTPGLHCLSVHSEEDLAIRDLILRERPDLILQCIDANQLKRSLILTCDLLELGVPMVAALNAIDESARRGTWIDSTGLSRLLGIPVIETIATQGRGIGELKRALANARVPAPPVRYGEIMEETISDLQAILPNDVPHSRKIALLKCMGDSFIGRLIGGDGSQEVSQKMKARLDRFNLQFKGSVVAVVARARSRWVDEITEKVSRQQKIRPGQLSRSFGHLSRHPVFGIPILFFFLVTTFFLVVRVGGFLADMLDVYLTIPVLKAVSHLVPAGFWNDMIVGEEYGLLPLGLFNAISTVLPILLVFLFMLGVLEDIGYISNLCVLTKRIFDKVGLKGRSVLSLVLGFGCKTMATLTTAGLPRKEKLIAVYLISATVPCSAQLGLSMALLGRYTFWAFLITYGTVLVMAIIAGLLLNRIVPETGSSDFIQELPSMRLPNPTAVAVKTGYRLYWFLKEAVPIFLIAALALFLSDKIGILGALKTVLRPIVTDWLGMPLGMVDALIMTVARHEAGVGTLIRMADADKLNLIQCMEAVLLLTIFVPCFANIVAMCRRVGTKMGLQMTGLMNVSGLVLVSVFHWVLVFFKGILA